MGISISVFTTFYFKYFNIKSVIDKFQVIYILDCSLLLHYPNI